MEFLNEKIMEALNKGNNIAIAGHTNPDGDAIGSCFALALGLKKIGKNPIVILEDYNEKFNIIPGNQFVFKGDINSINPDTFVSLDCGSVERLGEAGVLLSKTNETICIDHHVSSNFFAKYNYIDQTISSTCEMVFELIINYLPLDVEIATALYTGIVFDTGGFRHSGTTSKTLEIAGKLMRFNIPFSKIYNEIMYSHSLVEAKIFAKAIERLVVVDDLHVSYTYIKHEDLNRLGIDHKYLNGIVEYALNIPGVRVSIFIYEMKEGSVKVSLRSKEIDISQICLKMGGGGHMLAAGYSSQLNIESAFNQIISLLKVVLV